MPVTQEFFCTESGGGCGGYIVFPLNMKLNRVVEVVCPNCGHEHRRKVKDGLLYEDGRWEGKPDEQITPTLAAFSEEPSHPDSKNLNARSERNAVVIEDEVQEEKPKPLRNFLSDRWFEIFGSRGK